MPNNPVLTSEDLFGLAIQGLSDSIKKPNVLSFGEKSYPEQDRFFRSQKMGRFVSGGNRGGKTDAIVIDAVWTATNTHPFRKRNPLWGNGAVFLRFLVPDVSVGITQTMVPKFQRWVPEHLLRGQSWSSAWDSNNYILNFSNGSTIDFVTHKMDLMKLGSVPRHAIYFDEEPPQDIFNELMMRLIDFEGFWCIAATPTRGITWTNDLLWEPALDPQDPKHAWIDTFTLSAAQNPFNLASDESMRRYQVGMSDEERRIRETGEFVSKSGFVFPNFRAETHVIEPMMPPKSWAWYGSVDFGYNNPTAWLWHAVSPNGDIYTFAEHYASGMTVPEHADVIHARERSWGKEPEIRTGDPHGDQRSGLNGMTYLSEYANRGIYIGTDGIPRGEGSVIIGIEKMQQYFRVRERGYCGMANRPKWVISANCNNFIKELKRLQWGTFESDHTAYNSNKKDVVKSKDDHAFDAARYFSILMPDLRPDSAFSEPEMQHLDYGTFMAMMAEGEIELATTTATGPQWSTEYLEEDEW